MRSAIAAAVVSIAALASAEPLPPASLEVLGGGTSGTGADAKPLGFGYVIGAEAAWQPMATERRWGWTVRWATLFGRLYDGTAATIDDSLRTVQMDLTLGIRFRPWATPSRYLTARAGGGLLRTNDPVGSGGRAFIGPVTAVGIDQYIGSFVMGIDVRYGMIANGPEQVQLVVRLGVAGP
ncbi:MAG TPA: hypothetical protein VLX92_05570 [Kofleriaceae bacterium]|nr:hypothetical protein [Kofleriaceae bacterium]